MNRDTNLVARLFFCVLTMSLQAQCAPGSTPENMAGVRIEVTGTRVTGHTLKIGYRITNDSGDDAWFLVGTAVTDMPGQIQVPGMSAEVVPGEDGNVPVIRTRIEPLRLDRGPVCRKYDRLRAGESQTEWIHVRIPWHYSSQVGREERLSYTGAQTGRLVLELNYYLGNLPESFFKNFEEVDDRLYKERPLYPRSNRDFGWHGGAVLDLNAWNEALRSRDEEFLFPGGSSTVRGERVLRTIVDDVHVPYLRDHDKFLDTFVPDLSSYTRVEMHFQPSMLEFFFPYGFQQGLMTPDELEHFGTAELRIVQDNARPKVPAQGIWEVFAAAQPSRSEWGPAIRRRSNLKLVCFSDATSQESFVVRWERDRLLRSDDFVDLLETFMPRIKTIDVRMQCGANLKNLWYRLRLYRHAEARRLKNPSVSSQTTYPLSPEWCDAMSRPYNPHAYIMPLRASIKWDVRIHVCPGAQTGKNHYAMNPNCKPNSAADTVLLFETADGWNQHGGPELFTFDNHDPKGGCVLLNDGTVKFIRTKEELHQLRWK